MTIPVLLVLLGSLAAGLLLIAIGWRGRRLNDHPICRWCGFDVSGTWPASPTCPECGAGLKRERAIRIGQRRRRRVPLALGAVLVVFPVLLLVGVFLSIVSGSSIDRFKPVGLLLFESRFAGPERSAALAAELVSRQSNGTLSAAQRARVVGAALRRQGDPACPWDTAWGELIDDARVDGTLSDADTNRFLNQAAVVDVVARARLRAGDPLPLMVDLAEARVGPGSQLLAAVHLGAASIDGKAVGRERPTSPFPFQPPTNVGPGLIGWFQLLGANSGWGPGGQSYGSARVLLDVPADLGPGRHRLDLEIDIRTQVWNPRGGWQWNPTSARPTGPDVRTIRRSLEFTVAGGPSEGLETIPPTPEATAKLAEALRPEQLYGQGGGFGGEWVNVSIDLGDVPVPCAFEVVARRGEREWKLGTIASGRSCGDTNEMYLMPQEDADTRQLAARVARLDVSTVELVFRPSAEAALRTVDQTRFYGGEVVVADVAVQRFDEQGIPSGGGLLGAILRALAR